MIMHENSASSNPDDRLAVKELQAIPGVGKSIALDLIELGVKHVKDLRGADPEDLYMRHCELRGYLADRCLLYVFRCAVYFANTINPEPELLKWWRWKD